MRLWAKIRFNSETRSIDAALLISAFFQDFDDKSAININGQEALLEVHFSPSSPPLKLLSIIKHFEHTEMHIGNDVATKFEGKEVPIETVIQAKQAVPTESIVQVKPPKQAQVTKPKDEEKPIGSASLSEIDELAQKAYSFSEFMLLFNAWLPISGKTADSFWLYVKAASNVSPVTWTNIKEYLKENGYTYSQYGYAQASSAVFYKFGRTIPPVSILSLIKALVPYISFDYGKDKEKGDDNQVKIYAMSSVPNTDKLRVALESVDKTSTFTERATSILEAMGFHDEAVTDEQRETMLSVIKLCEFVPQINAEFLSTINPMHRMIFSTFVNMYATKNCALGPVHLLDFLNDLMKFIR